MADQDTAPAGMRRQEADKQGFKFFISSRCKRGHDGRRYVCSGECVECCVAKALKKQKDDPQYARDRNQRYNERHPEVGIARKDRWLEDPANREKQRDWTRRWQEENPDKVKEACHNWRDANLEYDRARKRQWLADNPELAREACRRRRALLKGAAGSHTIDEIMTLLEVQGGICAGPGCGEDILDSWTIDHKVPLSRRGSDDADNLQLLCQPCNSSKNDRTMEEWTGRRAVL